MSDTLNLKNSYALIVGVGGDDLKATIEDANALNRVFGDKKLAGYLKKNIFLLTEKNATKEALLTKLDEIIAKTKDVDDATVFIYYSGHGGRFERNNHADQFDYYLLTHGYNLDDPGNTMLSGVQFSKKINEIKAEKLLVLLDCCHAGGMKKKTRGIQRKGLTAAAKKIKLSTTDLIKQLKGGMGKVFISSCADDQESVILDKSKNSLFTEVTLEALKGKASGKDPFVKVIDLMYHVVREVPRKLEKIDHQQNPVISTVENLDGKYCLCVNSRTASVRRVRGVAPITKGLLTDHEKMSFLKNYPKEFIIDTTI